MIIQPDGDLLERKDKQDRRKLRRFAFNVIVCFSVGFIVFGWFLSYLHPIQFLWRSHANSDDPFVGPNSNASEVIIGYCEGQIFWRESTLIECSWCPYKIQSASVILKWIRSPRNEFTDGVQLYISHISGRVDGQLPGGTAIKYSLSEKRVFNLGENVISEVFVRYWLLLFADIIFFGCVRFLLRKLL